MRYLLDTHALIWMRSGDPRLNRSRWEGILASEENEIFVSVVSFWEIAIKRSLGKLTIEGDLVRLSRILVHDQGFLLLPMEVAHLDRLEKLPHHHRDPFDRILIAQAMELGATAITDDAQWRPYRLKTDW
jgi:PIN domain nuclease of toxin-antitoxin system